MANALDAVAAGKVNYNYTEIGGAPAEELPGLSVFYQDAGGSIFHTYPTYARGLDILVGTYNFLDLVPKGRNEQGLAHSMDGCGIMTSTRMAIRSIRSQDGSIHRSLLRGLGSLIAAQAKVTIRTCSSRRV